MKKNKLFIFLSIMAFTCFFAVSALCSQCGSGSKNDEPDKIDIDRETQDFSTSYQTAARDSVQEDTSADTAAEEASPTVNLRVYEGPKYSAEDDVCYYRIEAIIGGNPLPDKAVFSKDDSHGAWGPFRAQVNLTRARPSYTLTATVSTTAGTDSNFIEIRWGCEGTVPEDEDDCMTVYLAPVTYYDGTLRCNTSWYYVCQVNDPEGNEISDLVSYTWDLSEGTDVFISRNPNGTSVLHFTTPATPGTITLSVTATHGSCRITESVTIEIVCD